MRFTHTNTYCDANIDCYRHRDGYANSNCCSDCYTHANSDSGAHPNYYTDRYTYIYGHFYSYTYSNAQANADAARRSNAKVSSHSSPAPVALLDEKETHCSFVYEKKTHYSIRLV